MKRMNMNVSILIAIAVTSMASPAFAVPAPSLSFQFGAPALNGNSLAMEVSASYSAGDNAPDSQLVFLEFNVSASSAELTGGGTSFTGFNFVPGPILADWDEFANFGLVPFASYSLNTSTNPLSALTDGTYSLGTLIVDISAAAPGSVVTVAISDAPASDGAVESPVGDQSSFRLIAAELGGDVTVASVQVTRPASEIPEPATAALCGIGMILLSRRTSRRIG